MLPNKTQNHQPKIGISENQERHIQIHVDSLRRWMDTRDLYWYQGSGSSQSSDKGQKSSLIPFLNGDQKCQLKKMHNLEVERWLYLVARIEDWSPRHSISDNSERQLPRSKGWGAGYIGIFASKIRYLELQKITVRAKQISPVKSFSAFLCMGRCKSLR